MGLRDRPPVGMDERFRFHPATDTVYVDFEGLQLVTAPDADGLAAELDRRFTDLGRRVHVVVNYDNFDLGPEAADAFFAMVKRNEERYFLSTTRYSTSAFYRRQFGRKFDERDIYGNFSKDRRRPAGRVGWAPSVLRPH